MHTIQKRSKKSAGGGNMEAEDEAYAVTVDVAGTEHNFSSTEPESEHQNNKD